MPKGSTGGGNAPKSIGGFKFKGPPEVDHVTVYFKGAPAPNVKTFGLTTPGQVQEWNNLSYTNVSEIKVASGTHDAAHMQLAEIPELLKSASVLTWANPGPGKVLESDCEVDGQGNYSISRAEIAPPPTTP